jgi:hypothetical protein
MGEKKVSVRFYPYNKTKRKGFGLIKAGVFGWNFICKRGDCCNKCPYRFPCFTGEQIIIDSEDYNEEENFIRNVTIQLKHYLIRKIYG